MASKPDKPVSYIEKFRLKEIVMEADGGGNTVEKFVSSEQLEPLLRVLCVNLDLQEEIIREALKPNPDIIKKLMML